MDSEGREKLQASSIKHKLFKLQASSIERLKNKDKRQAPSIKRRAIG